MTPTDDVPSAVAELRTAVDTASGALTHDVYALCRRLFAACRRDAQVWADLRHAAPEYGRAEFLACLDAEGRPVAADAATWQDFRRTVAGEPEFGGWFREPRAAGGQVTLMPARWLCHLAGLRHPTVQLFIDLPERPGHTLVQVRGLDRPAYPGCFDMPVAGHVGGGVSAGAALYREMAEELGLGPDDITDLAPAGNYEYLESAAGLCDREYRTVYRCRLASGGLAGIQFAADEVAAIAVFAWPQLQALAANFPDRLASGLRASLPLYRAG